MEIKIKSKKQIVIMCFISFLIGFFLAFSLVVLSEEKVEKTNLVVPEKNISQTVIVGPIEKEIQKININTATEKEFSNLPGIGESKALTIIEYRGKNGSFSNISELLNISGIGNSAYEKIKDMVVVK